jgi:hypothetical protein
MTDADRLARLERRMETMPPSTYVRDGKFVADPARISPFTVRPVEGREGIFEIVADTPPKTETRKLSGITIRRS